MDTKITNKETARVYTWGENCKSFVLLDTKDLSVKQEVMPPNTKEKLHFHSKAQQFFYILKGEALFYLEKELITIKQQEGIHIKPGTKHFIENRTNSEIEFLVISQPDTTHDRIISE